MRAFLLTGIVLLSLSGVRLVHAADLLRLVGRDAAACLHLQDPDQQWQQFEQSELARRFWSSSLFQDWKKSRDAAKLDQLRLVLEQVHGKPIRQQFRELFGREAALAIYLRDADKPRGVVLLKGESSAVMERAIDTWLSFDERKRERLSHRETPYFRTVKSAGADSPVFHVLLDDVFALTDSESLLQQVIELHVARQPDATIAERPEFAVAATRRSLREVAALHINPRAWDAALKTMKESAPESAVLQSVWLNCNWLTLTLNQEHGLQLDISADYDWTLMPSGWKKWVEATERTQLPLSRIPAGSLAVAGCVFDARSLSESLRSRFPSEAVLPNDTRQAYRVLKGLLLGLDPVVDVLPMLGPSAIACVVPGTSKEPVSLPADVVLAVEVQHSAAERSEPGLTAAFDNALMTGLNMAAAVHNAKSTRGISVVHQKTVDVATIHWAAPVAMVAPSYAVTSQNIVLASSPEACELFLQSPSTGTAPPYRILDGKQQILMIDTAAIRQLIQERHEWFEKQAARNEAGSAAEARVRQLTETLSVADQVWLTTQVDRKSITVSLGLDAAKP